MLGREDKGAATGHPEYKARLCPADASGVSGMDNLIDTIIKRAAAHRIVIVNESHTLTRHRDFTRQLLPKLRAQGFTVLAAETFRNVAEGQDTVEKHKDLAWPHYDDGHYSKEPAFGRLVRSAKALGFRLAAYERIHNFDDKTVYSEDEDINRRETQQAQHLAQLLKTMGPDEKLLIHAGYAHAREVAVTNRMGKELLWMAARLKALTGLEPLTVAQTECRSDGGDSFLASPPPKADPAWYDMIVSHPADSFNRGRSAWRRAAGDIEVKIPAKLRPKTEPLVIEAFVEGEPFDAVPMDRVYVEPGEDVPLSLPPGRYVVRAVKIPKKKAM
jgi:hypothetical protein